MRRKCCSARFNGKLRHMHKTSPPTLMRGKPYLWLIFGQDPFSSESIRPLSQTQSPSRAFFPTLSGKTWIACCDPAGISRAPGRGQIGSVWSSFLSRGSFRALQLRAIPSGLEAIVLWSPNWPAAGVSEATGRGQKRLGQCQPSATMPFHPHDDAARDDGRDKAALCTHR